MEHLLDGYVRKVKGFNKIPRTEKQFEILSESVKSSEIRIGVPKETTLDQWLTLQKSAMKAEQQGIKVTFGVEK